MRRLVLGPILAAALTLCACGGPAPESEPAAGEGPGPRLVLLLVVDQMRTDFLTRFEDLYEGGFRTLLDRGAFYTEAAYRHGVTVTGAGHATVATGLHPSSHGVVGNTWWDYAAGEDHNCVADSDYRVVGEGASRAASPLALEAETLGDRLAAAYPGSKTIGISRKDRSAILMAGRAADGAYWVSNECGCFVTSSYFEPDLPEWMQEFNAGRPSDRFAGQTWTRLIDDPTLYEARARPDAFATEGDGVATEFPYEVPAAPGAELYALLDSLPYSDELVADAAIAALDGEQLGRDGSPDVLAVSFSAADAVGHDFGPFSQEAMDTNLRLDRTLGRLLEAVDERVGLENVLIALTADHGAVPLVEFLDDPAAKRLASRDIAAYVNEALGKQAVVSVNAGNLYLDLDQTTVEAVATAVRKHPDAAEVFTAADLEGEPPADPTYWRLYRNSYYAPRSPQVFVRWKPNVYVGGPFGTGHGSPYEHDRRVPVLLAGPDIPAGRHASEAGPEDIAPTLGRRLGVEVPTEPDTRVLEY